MWMVCRWTGPFVRMMLAHHTEHSRAHTHTHFPQFLFITALHILKIYTYITALCTVFEVRP